MLLEMSEVIELLDSDDASNEVNEELDKKILMIGHILEFLRGQVLAGANSSPTTCKMIATKLYDLGYTDVDQIEDHLTDHVKEINTFEWITPLLRGVMSAYFKTQAETKLARYLYTEVFDADSKGQSYCFKHLNEETMAVYARKLYAAGVTEWIPSQVQADDIDGWDWMEPIHKDLFKAFMQQVERENSADRRNW